jgi:predicted GNAT family N-acyltransferase
MDGIKIKSYSFPFAEYEQVWQLREDILRRPIGLSLKDEDLSDDKEDVFFIAVRDDTLIGCLMLHHESEDIIKFRQMAVYPAWQGKGIGAMLMQAAEEWSAKKGYKTIVLHARVTAKDFYSKLGYAVISDVFTEVGIDHVVMEKTLNP